MRKLLVLLALAFPTLALAQNAALPANPHTQFLDSNGRPLAGGKIYTCTAGLSCPGNPLATYTDSTAGTPNANPVILDSTGYASIWIGSGSYKFVAQNSLGVTQWTQDNVSSSAIATAANITGANGAGLIQYLATGTGAVQRPVSSRLGDMISALDYATGNGSTDDTAKFQQAITAAGNGTVLLPCGTYLITGSGLTISNGASLRGMGTCSVINYTGTTQAIHVTSVSAINVRITDIKFIGTSSASTGAILVDAANLLTVIDHDFFVGFNNATANDIQVTTNNAEITSNYFAGTGHRAIQLTCGGGGAQYAQAVDVMGNTFGGTSGYSSEYVLSQCPHNRFLHNSFNVGASIFIHINGGNGQVIRDNWMEFAGTSFIQIDNASNEFIQNNFFDPQGSTSYGVRTTTASTNNIIQGNRLNSSFTVAAYSMFAGGGVYNMFIDTAACPSDLTQFTLAFCYQSTGNTGNKLTLRPADGGAQIGNIFEYFGGTGGALSDYFSPNGLFGIRTGGGYEGVMSVGRATEDFKLIANNAATAYMGGTLAGDLIIGSTNGNQIVMGNLAASTTSFLLNTTTKAFTFTGNGTVNGSLNIQGGISANGSAGISNTFTCTAGQHINALTIQNGIIIATPGCS